MARRHGMEEYLEAIYVLNGEGETVIPSRLADYLGVARPTVTQTVQRLTQSGYVSTGEGKEIVLTESGRERAEQVVRRHRLLERWLTDELGLDWADAHVEAGRLEHSISSLVERQLFERLGHPTTCPHGNVIPGSGASQPQGQPLSEVPAPADVRVIRIVEMAEEDLDLLRFLHRAGIVPGNRLHLTRGLDPYEAGIEVVVGDSTYALDESVARRVLVQPA
ncbi:MAG: metal-dependent transcriptional regulator [Alicyclobacillus herbarius]|uniref:metal-dependent transcriptional regulator n=1 Tax=Alicyclobacillus herbarius TaxID=122960 RepID=UPI0004183510|nr:metal-dependent transcriptional regulator [Alicyclobacillus herbarius]MCL6630990.1 metal-dependent transcriptional regulator [Alicyclobacillus herbarius]